jgi:NAD(P)-dependent dehydrogenase (short-subunit alcohol dehydrogenase family)
MAQRVFVTAGASGMGREIAQAFSGNHPGASVFVCDIDANAPKALEGEIAGVKTALATCRSVGIIAECS